MDCSLSAAGEQEDFQMPLEAVSGGERGDAAIQAAVASAPYPGFPVLRMRRSRLFLDVTGIVGFMVGVVGFEPTTT
jgi:hypothetical protein